MGLNTNLSMFNVMSMIIPIFIVLIFAIVIFSFVGGMVKNAKQNSKNNASPVLTVVATVTAKRTEMRSSRGNNMHHNHTRTNYFATFEVESGDRIEFSISGEQAGLLMENDYGTLTFQGTRYLGFERSRDDRI